MVRNNILSWLKERLGRNSGKQRALEYLEEFGDRFWVDMDKRVEQVTERLSDRVQQAGSVDATIGFQSAGLASSGQGSTEHEKEVTTSTEQTRRYQEIVNEAQLPLLNQMVDVLDQDVLDIEQHFVYLIIDDLDKNWVEEEIRLQLVRCLLEAVIDLQRINGLKIIVALRTNLLMQLDYASQRHGPQEEKLKSLMIDLRWSINDLIDFLEIRVDAASEYYEVQPPITLSDLLPLPSSSRPDALDFIIERTLMRPRDAIAYLNLAVRAGGGKRRLSWDDIRAVEQEYSTERLVALRDEWKDPYIHIDMVLDRFRRCSNVLDAKEMSTILDDIASHVLGDREFRGANWLEPLCRGIYANDTDSENSLWNVKYGELIELLYRIGLIGVKNTVKSHPVYSYSSFSDSESLLLEESTFYEIHPTFRAGLNTRFGT